MRLLEGGCRLLTMEEMHKIHETMLAILDDPGLEVQLPERGLRKLADAGLRVDSHARRVRFDPEPVLETIRQFTGAATSRITREGSANPPQPLRLPSAINGTIGSTHGFIFDVDKWNIRPATCEDFINFTKIARSLDGVSPVVGMLPQDVPPEVAYVHSAALSAKYNRNPYASANGQDDSIWVARVLQAAGTYGDDAPYIMSSHNQPSGALLLSARAAEDTLRQAEDGQLTYLAPCGFLGGNHPVTIPGALAQDYSELFGCNTISRLLTKPPNNKFSPQPVGNDHLIMDLRRGAFSSASPNSLLIRLCMRQISGEFYKFPGGGGFITATVTDSLVPGIQASLEWGMGVACELMAGVYSYKNEVQVTVKALGRLHANLALCAEQVLIDYEGLLWLRRFFTGQEINENTLALDAIRAVGPGGEFASAEHTVKNFRREFWFPTLLHRGAWSAYLEGGQRTPLDIAKERIKEILKQDLEPVLSADRCRDVECVVAEAEKALLGKTTGVCSVFTNGLSPK